MSGSNVRKSILAGTWYPGSSRELTATVDQFLSNVPSPTDNGDLLGLVAPHAGYIYSGQVAAHAYKQIQGLKFDLVAIISPVHRISAGDFVVTDYGNYETPLGLVPVDQELVDRLNQDVPITRVHRDDEHSIEIQLPFLQRTLSGFALLPVMQGDQSLPASRTLAAALQKLLLDRKALLVASSDLSHFHSYDRALILDGIVREHIDRNDPIGLAESLGAGQAEACGGGPVITAMLAAQGFGADRATVLHYANSGDVSDDRSRVVGYLAAGLYRSSHKSVAPQ